MRIVQECSDEEMAVISAAVKTYIESSEGSEGEVPNGWKFSGRASWHRMGFFERHSLRNSKLSTWRRVGLDRFG